MIRTILPEDVSSVYVETLNSPLAMQFMGSSKGINHTKQSVQQYVQAMLYSETDLFFGIFKDDILCGTTRLHDIGIDKKSLWQGILVFLPYQSKGLGFQLVQKVSDFALIELEIAKIFAGILKNNAASQHIFHKAGFNHTDNDSAYHGRQIWVKSSVQKIIQ